MRIVDAGPVAVEEIAAPEELEGALEVVAARLGHHRHEAALATAELGGRAGRLHFDLLDRFEVELLADFPCQGVDGRDPVHQRHHVGVARSVDVRVAVAVDVADAGRQAQHVLVVATENRQVFDELVGEAGGGGGLLRVHHVGAGLHAHLLAHLARGPQRQRHDGHQPGGQLDVGDRHAREAGERRADHVPGPGRQRGDAELSVRVGDGAARRAEGRMGDGDRGAGDRRAVLVQHHSANSGDPLRERKTVPEQHAQEEDGR
jgi:hypothetical protein